MKNSTLQTVAVPAIGAPRIEPSLLYQAGDKPMRVVVRNNGGSLVLLAHDVAAVSQINSTGGTFSLPPGQSEVIVLAPKQSLLAASQGGGGLVSIAASEAIPVGKAWMES